MVCGYRCLWQAIHPAGKTFELSLFAQPTERHAGNTKRLEIACANYFRTLDEGEQFGGVGSYHDVTKHSQLYINGRKRNIQRVPRKIDK
jgi:hypothetical protein